MWSKHRNRKMGTEAEHVGADREVNARASRGITLVETLVAFAIVSVTFVIVLDTFLTTNRATQAAERRAAVADALSYALADMAREAQVSENFSVTASGSSKKWSMQRRRMEGIDTAAVYYRITSTSIFKSVDGQEVRLLPPTVSLPEYNITISNLPDTPSTPNRVLFNLVAMHKADLSNPSNHVSVQVQFTERGE